MLKNERLESRVRELEKELRVAKEGAAKKKRSRIPDTGFAIRSYDDYQAMFEAQEQQAMVDGTSRVEKLKTNLLSLTERLTKTRQKREKYEKLEAENKRPKNWKPASEIAREEGRLEVNLTQAATQLTDAEQHLRDLQSAQLVELEDAGFLSDDEGDGVLVDAFNGLDC